MLLHCSHNIDTNVLLDNMNNCHWYPVDQIFDTSNCVEVEELPNKIGRWKVGEWYYELNDKLNWMRWQYNGERFKYTWSRRKNKGNTFNEHEQLIENEVEKFMSTIGVDDWGWRFLKIMPDDKMIWHIDSPNHAPCSINISLKDKSPIVFDDREVSYDCALISVSDEWHTVKSGDTERLTFKIIPKAPFEEVKQKLGDFLL